MKENRTTKEEMEVPISSCGLTL